MSTDRVIEIALAVMTFIVGYVSFRLAGRTTQVQERAVVRSVDAAAFERAKEIYESAVSTLRGELNDTRSDLASARSDLLSARSEIAALRKDVARLEGEIRVLRFQQNREKADIQLLQEKQQLDEGEGT